MTRLDHDWFPEALPSNVVAGEATWIYSSFAFRHYRSRVGVVLGAHSGVYNGTFFDLGADGSVVVGDYCSIVGAIFATRGSVTIGHYTFIAHEVVFADFPFATPPDVVVADRPRYSSIIVGENVWIGAHAVILAGSRIGDGAVVGAAAVVQGEIPALAVAAGNPATVVGHVRSKEPD